MPNFKEQVIFDEPRKWGKNVHKWSHLVAQDIETLHIFADKLGFKRTWFQVSNSGIPHYDIKTASKRELAKKLGAIEVKSSYLLLYASFHGLKQINHRRKQT